MCTLSLCSLHVYLVFSACVLLFVLPVLWLRHVHLRPAVILRVYAHSVNGSRKHVPCCRTSAVAELVVAFTDPGSILEQQRPCYWMEEFVQGLTSAGSADVSTNGDR